MLFSGKCCYLMCASKTGNDYKMKSNNFLLAFLLTLVSVSANGKQFLVVNNGLTVQVPNGHRTLQPALKFSLFGGARIVKTDEHVSENEANSTAYTLQLSDHSSMKLKALEKRSFNVSEYYLQWNGGGPNNGRELCFHTDFNNATWFSTYQSSRPHWPMERMAHSLPLLRFNSMLDYTALGEQEFYRVVEHLFLTTDGFALLLDGNAPWFMRRDVSKSLLCFAVNNTVPYDTADHSSSYLDLKIHLFTASNIRAVTDYVVHRSGLIPRPKEIPDSSMFTDPSYGVYNVKISTVNQSELLAYAETINKLEFAPAEIMLDDRWSNFNSITGFDNTLYPDPAAMIATMHKRYRLKLRLQVYPTANPDSSASNNYFVKWSLNGPNSGVVDFSNPKAATWFGSNIKRFRNSTGVDTFRIGGTVLAQNRFVVHDRLTQKYPNLFITRYIETMEKLQPPRQSITDVAFKSQHLPAFVRLSNYHQTPPEESLRQLVANALAVSVAGYSFIEPYQIGGFASQPSTELYIRFVQATALMPRMSFAFAPWVIGKGNDSSQVVSITKRFIALHRAYSPTIIELAKRRVSSGEPIVRPMWYAAPDDGRTYQLNDQFMLGENVVVAPVLVIGQRERTVFLPPGMWVDKTGAHFSGSAVVTVKVPLDQLPFFKRVVS